MKKIYYSICLFVSLTLSCILLASCIQDEIQACQYRIRLKYDYNMDYVDKFLVQAQKLSLLIFDKDQRLYQLVKLEGNPLLQQRELAIDLPTALAGQEFTFLAWVGLDESYFELTALQVGVTTRQEVEVALKTNTAFSTAQVFQAFMQGSLSTPVEPNQVYEIPLVKNNNKFRIAFRISPAVQTDAELLQEDYEVSIEADNSRYDSDNHCISDQIISYTSYFTENDERGFIVELNTLRLVDGRNNQLIVSRVRDGERLLVLNLNDYLEDLRFLSHQSMPKQEFLDRQDQFAILFLMGDKGFYGSFDIEINGWLIREAGYGKE